MNRRLLSLVAAVFFVPGGVASADAAMASATDGAQGSTTIMIDGAPAGTIVSWEGGDPRASVVPGPTAEDGTATKQPGAPVCAPLVMQCAFPPAGPLRDWLAGFLSEKPPRGKIVLTDYDAMGRAVRQTEFGGASLAEVRMPALDAANSTPGVMTFVLSVQESREVTPAAATASALARTSSAGFRLAIDGLDGRGVLRIEPVSITRASKDEEFLANRTSTTTPGAIEFSNLTVTMKRETSATWRAWFTDFVINGKGGDESEKSGALEFLSADLKQVVFALRFEHMGILRVSRVNVAAGAPELVQAELYFEKCSIATAPTSGDPDSSTQAAIDEPQQGTSSGSQDGESTYGETSGTVKGTEEEAASGESTYGETSGTVKGTEKEATIEGETLQPVEAVLMQTPTTATATGMLSAAPTTNSSDTTSVSVSERFTAGGATVTDSATSPTTAATVSSTTSTAVTNTNPADQGSRDPAGFPRVSGLTRLDFSGQYHTTSTSEESHYTTPDKIYDVLARVDAAAKSAGWTLAHFAEGYSQGEKWVSEQWKKDNSNVALSIYQPDTGITRYWIRVTTQIPEAN